MFRMVADRLINDFFRFVFGSHRSDFLDQRIINVFIHFWALKIITNGRRHLSRLYWEFTWIFITIVDVFFILLCFKRKAILRSTRWLRLQLHSKTPWRRSCNVQVFTRRFWRCTILNAVDNNMWVSFRSATLRKTLRSVTSSLSTLINRERSLDPIHIDSILIVKVIVKQLSCVIIITQYLLVCKWNLLGRCRVIYYLEGSVATEGLHKKLHIFRHIAIGPGCFALISYIRA